MACLVWVALGQARVQAAPFDEQIAFTQPGGQTVVLRGWGDEFYAVFETLDGYTAVFDPQIRAYCYAKVAPEGTLLSTGIAVGTTPPAALGLEKGVRMSNEARRLQVRERRQRWEDGLEIERAWAERKAALRAFEAGGDTVLSPPSFTTTGNKVGLTLLVDFSDAVGTVPQAEVLAFCNSDNYAGNGNNGSVKKYFHDNSNGLLTYSNVVTIYIRAPLLKSYYNDTTQDCGDQGNLLIKDVLDTLKALPNYATEILPAFDGLTVDASSRVVACNVFYAGGNGDVWSYGLWPHAWSLYNVGAQPLGNGKSVYRYQITNLGSSLSLGTFCHENGHLLCGFPDIYDYQYDSSGGAGGFCLMNSGGSGGNPTQISAYLKRAAGWATTVNVTSNSTVIATVGTTGTNFNRFYRLAKPGVSTEYYLVENRQKTGRDANIPGPGVLIWHVDELGNHDNQNTNYNTTHANYEVSLIQADNQYHLQRDVNNGDTRDPFYLGNSSPGYINEFSLLSAPPARWWDGTPSGAIFSGFSANGVSMTFRIGPPEPPLTVVSAFFADANGNGRVEFNETNHYWVALRNDGTATASNVTAVLSTTTSQVSVPVAAAAYPNIAPGQTATNVIPFVFVTAPGFACGTPIRFTALASVPGRTTTNAFTESGGVAVAVWRSDNEIQQSIPSLGTILSTNLVSGFTGALGRVQVSLYLTHARDSDLVIDLVAPDGTTNNLVNRRGGTGDHFGSSCAPDSSRTTFDDSAAQSVTSGVAPFAGAYRPEGSFGVHLGKPGAAVNGPWHLRVRDAVSGTSGILRCWSLALTAAPECVDGGALPPAVTLDSPADRSVLTAGEPIWVRATVSDPDSLLGPVTFHAGDTLLTTLNDPPFEFLWSNAPPGAHVIRVRAEDVLGLSATAHALIGVDDGRPMRWAGGVSGRWSEGFNWTHFRAPTNGEPLVFSGPARLASTNDLLATISGLLLDGEEFILGGNWLTLSGGLTNSGGNTLALPVRLAGAQNFSGQAGLLTVAGNVTNAGATLTLDGSGDLRFEGIITGTGGLQKLGAGTSTFTQTNNYTGSTVVHAGTLALARGGTSGALRGSLTINPGATVRTEVADALGTGASRANPVAIAGGTLSHTANSPLSLWGMTVLLTGGTVEATGSGDAALVIGTDAGIGNASTVIVTQPSTNHSVIAGNQVRLAQGSTLVNVSDGPAHPDLVITAPIFSAINPSGLSKVGAGTLRLDGTNQYNGVTSISGGALLVNGTLGTNQVTVASGTLGGHGRIAGRVVVNSAGTLTPGDGVGELTINQVLQLGGSARFEVLRSAGTLTHDAVVGLTSVTYGGQLVVTNLGEPLEAGDSFRLFHAAAYLGSFAAHTLPPLADGLAWDLSALPLSGTVRVAALPVLLNEPMNQVVLAGDAVTFTGLAGGTPPLIYQWRKDGVSVPGATDELLHLPAVTVAEAGGYTLAVTNLVGSVTSAPALLTVVPGSPPLDFAWQGGGLTLEWPAVPGLRLQSQTNAPGTGLGPLWYDVPGVTTNRHAVPVDAAAGAVFYRLFRP